MTYISSIFSLFILTYFSAAFHQKFRYCKVSSILLSNKKEISESYLNPITAALGRFLPAQEASPLDKIDWSVRKQSGLSINKLALKLEKLLNEREWFVTGNVEPSLFDEDFEFKDPDVQLKGIESYARGVRKLFNQKDSRAEIIAVEVDQLKADTITVTWRLSGSVNVGFGIRIKPYIVYSDLRVSRKSGLIVFQEDRFSIPTYDILLSALFPFLASNFAPPAPPVEILRKEFILRKK